MFKVYGFDGLKCVSRNNAPNLSHARTVADEILAGCAVARIYEYSEQNGDTYERLVETRRPKPRLVTPGTG